MMERCIEVLDAVARVPHGRSQADLAAELGLPKPTVSRLVQSLCSHDMLCRDDRRRVYVLGPAVIRWGMAAVGDLEVTGVARPHLESLCSATAETVHLGILDGASVLYLDRVESPRAVRMASRLGGAMPAHSTALGKALLAGRSAAEVDAVLGPTLNAVTDRTIVDPRALAGELAAVRARGVAVEDGENEDGVACVAAGVCDHTGRAIAAVSVSAPRFRLAAPDEHAERVCRCAQQISVALGHRPTDVRV